MVDFVQNYKECMSRWATGVALVTLLDKTHQPQGLLISSLASVSLEPTLISFALSQQSALYNQFCQTSFFAVNILAQSQQDIAQAFLGPHATRWQNLVEGPHWHKGPTTACPILPESLAVLECAVQQRVPVGDHDMFVAHVLEATPLAATEIAAPLLYFSRGFQELAKI